MPDLDAVRRHYASLAEKQLLQIALYEVADLTPDGVSILRAELDSRGLGGRLEAALDAQLANANPAAQAQSVDRLRQLPCPHCGANHDLLNAFEVAQVESIVFLTRYQRSLVIGCSQCISRAASEAMWRTFFLGWWGFPWGPIRTIQALIKNFHARRAANYTSPTAALLAYVATKPGEVALLISLGSAERNQI